MHKHARTHAHTDRDYHDKGLLRALLHHTTLRRTLWRGLGSLAPRRAPHCVRHGRPRCSWGYHGRVHRQPQDRCFRDYHHPLEGQGSRRQLPVGEKESTHRPVCDAGSGQGDPHGQATGVT
jgi:hypothetical protein